VSTYRRRTDPRTGQRYYEHRAVAEWHLGRPLEPGEVVHHVNEIQGDDHPENLQVLPSAPGEGRAAPLRPRDVARAEG
jgi:hypothetical protein